MRHSSLLAAISLLLIPLAAGAEPDEAAAKTRAGELLQAGNDRFAAADYTEALRLFEAAHAEFPSPKIFFNIGSALRKLGRDEEAAQAFERFLAETPDPPDVGEDKRLLARGALTELRERLARPKTARPQPTVVAAPPPPERPAHHGRALKVVGGVVAALGLISLGTATYFGVDAGTAASDVERFVSACSTATPCDAAAIAGREATGKNDELAMAALVSAGAAMAIVGMALYAVGWRQAHVAPISASLSRGGTFAW